MLFSFCYDEDAHQNHVLVFANQAQQWQAWLVQHQSHAELI
jgi:hypothetical protein